MSRRMRRLLGAYTVNRIGSWIGLVALSLAVFDRTHSPLAVAGLLLAWQALPALLVPAMVARVESSRGAGALSSIYALEAMLTSGLALLTHDFWLPAVLLLAALDGTAALTANALQRAELARVARRQVEPQDGADGPSEAAYAAERRANAALNVCFSISFVAGPVIAGVITAAAGAPVALLIDVATFLVCGALLLDFDARVETAGDSVRERLKTAWSHVGDTPALRDLLLAQAVALVFIQAAGPIEVAYVKATLHGGDRGYGLFVTAWGAGVVLASVVFARARIRPLGAMLTTGVLALGLAFIGVALAPSLALACAAAFLGGFGNGLDLPSLICLVQRLTPQDLHGRLMGGVESLTALCLAAGLPLGGALVALSSTRVAFLVIGCGAIATTAVFARLSVRGLREPAAPKPGGAAHEPEGLAALQPQLAAAAKQLPVAVAAAVERPVTWQAGQPEA